MRLALLSNGYLAAVFLHAPGVVGLTQAHLGRRHCAQAPRVGSARSTANNLGQVDATGPALSEVVGELLVQRSIQTQLYYLHDLRDEPTAHWLQSWQGHEHLDAHGGYGGLLVGLGYHQVVKLYLVP